MPAVVKRTVGSFSGTTEAEGMIVCPFSWKKSRNFWRISLVVIADRLPLCGVLGKLASQHLGLVHKDFEQRYVDLLNLFCAVFKMKEEKSLGVINMVGRNNEKFFSVF